MGVKDILVHLDGGPPGPRLALAADLARRLGAHLAGLFVVEVPLPVLAGADGGGGLALAALIEQLREAEIAKAALRKAEFEAALAPFGLAGEWRQEEGAALGILPRHARHADLLVLGQPESEDGAAMARVEAALFASGRPLLMVPHAGAPARIGRRVLVGWNASREAARALHDALPLMAGAEAVTVLVANPEATPGAHGDQPGADIARHLARHGLAVTVQVVASPELGAGELLLNAAADLGADLLVMGGYGHSRLREWILGGATRTLLREATLPVLMSH
ncbi:MAG: universal stress protein [Roseococcus sp.]|nr:universal stress protein [Roseococcus sp.]